MFDRLKKPFRARERKKWEALGYTFADEAGKFPLTIAGCSACFGWSSSDKMESSSYCLCCQLVLKALTNLDFDMRSDIGDGRRVMHQVRVQHDLATQSLQQKIDIDCFGQQFEIYALSGNPALPARGMTLTHLGSEQKPWLRLKQRAHITGNTGSPEAFAWARDCYRRCLHHTACSRKLESPLPTRVLDIGTSIEGGQGHDTAELPIKLYESKGEDAQYCSLSHCWGEKQIIRTTKATIEQHKQAIPWRSLSKTFQDAIVFARSLQIRYIWIDSLCIIQDDEQDWQKESVKMFEVYSNSTLTIAATKSAGGDGGCFAVSSKTHQSHRVEYEFEGKSYELFIRQKIAHEQYRHNMRMPKALPLLGRGWVLQERLSSPRVLHFGPQELVFECRTKVQCECAEDAEQSSKYKHDHNIADGSESEVADYYRSLVVSYSRLKFTYESDRLQAFSGIVAMFMARRNDGYFSGVWRKSIVRDLLWHVYWTEVSPKTKRGLFPSWSWASINSHVEYLDTDDYGIRDCKSQLKSISANDKHLTVCGYMASARMSYRSDSTIVPNVTPFVEQVGHYLEPTESRLHGLALKLEADYTLMDSAAQEDDRFVGPGSPLHCFKLAETEKCVYSLVLSPRNMSNHLYERIGICRQWKSQINQGLDLYGTARQLSTITVV